MPWSGGGVSITSPAGGAQLVVGTYYTVTGTASTATFIKPNTGDEFENVPTKVTAGVDSGGQLAVTATSAGWASWRAPLRLLTPGTHRLRAVAHYGRRGNSHQADTEISIEAVAAPLDLVAPTGPVTTQQFGVVVVGRHTNDLTALRVRADQLDWVALQLDAEGIEGDLRVSRWVQTQPLRLNDITVAPGGRTVSIDLQGTSGDGAQHDRTVTIGAWDGTSPEILKLTPEDGGKVPGTGAGAYPPVRVTVRDPGDGRLTSGIEKVQVVVDGTAVHDLVRTADPGPEAPSVWEGRIPIPPGDDHQITARATDKVGNAVEVTHDVLVTAPADLRNLDPQTYLADLLLFAGQRLLTRPWDAPVDGDRLPPFVTRAQLAEAVAQDVDGVLDLPLATATAPVRTLRLVTEVLGRAMRPPAPAPLAAWPLHDGQGAVSADTAGGLCDGQIQGATWTADGDLPVLRFDAANGDRVEVAATAANQTRARDAMTLVARIRPSAATAGNGVILAKEGEWLLARTAGGTVAWALSTDAAAGGWVDTGVAAPEGQWTHVAVSYDSTQPAPQVRTWISGMPRHAAGASGPIANPSPGSAVWIGGRPNGGEHFSGNIADVAVFDRALSEYEVHRLIGRSDDAGGDHPWVDDDLPLGATPATANDDWTWVSADPAPSTGARCHRSRAVPGRHQHLFTLADSAFPVDAGDTLVTDVSIDPADPPREVMLQWQDSDGDWSHRAYWGEDLIDWGTPDSSARRPFGDLPPAGSWTTLRVPARAVGLEHRTVRGVAFALMNGTAAWDRTGRLTARTVAAGSGYLQAAYAALLRAHGTSELELRLARGAGPKNRRALAERLGFSLADQRPDELDALLRDPSALSAADLAELFGYVDPLGSTAAGGVSLLRQWRLAALRARWRASDHGTEAVARRPPVVDPEVLVPDDLRSASDPAAVLLSERIAWRGAQMAQLDGSRAGAADDAEAVATAIGQVLIDVDLDALAADRRAGKDISGPLAEAALTLRGFLRVLTIRDLAENGPLRAEEWTDLVVVLTQVLRVRNWPAWREAERIQGIATNPAVFRDSTADGGASLPDFVDVLARQDWLDRLIARESAVGAVTAGEARACAAADDAALPLLRDALVAALRPGDDQASAQDALTDALLVDVGAGAQDVTTRLNQTLEVLQGLMFAARRSTLDQTGPLGTGRARRWVLKNVQGYGLAEFDDEWQWMGTYAAWRAAVSVFFRPELMLYPALRVGDATMPPSFTPTAAFGKRLEELRGYGNDVDAQTARELADAFKQQLLGEVADAELAALADLLLTDQLTPTQLSSLARRQAAELTWPPVLDDAPRNRLEALWLVPLQLAVALARAGQYGAATDWLRTLYAPELPAAERIVFAGFRAQDSGDALSRPEAWLLKDELNPHRIAQGRARTHLRFVLVLLARCVAEQADAEFTADTLESRPRARALYLAAERALRAPEFDDSAASSMRIPRNPALAVLRGRTAANLAKLRRGLTIAGLPRVGADPQSTATAELVIPSGDGGGPTPPTRPPLPTPYRYATLIARAQQLVASAAQIEGSYVSALAGADTAGYTEQRAGEDLELAKARSGVQRAAAQVAELEVLTAEAQITRAHRQVDILSAWIAGGESDWEDRLLESYNTIADVKTLVAFGDAAVATFSAVASGGVTGAASAAMVAAAATRRYLGAQSLAQAEARAQEAATRASFERRLQEWQRQEALARDDVALARSQADVVKGRARIAASEADLAGIQERHAQAAVTFLAGRRLTGEVYAWMAGELGDVYRYLLRQATSVAQLAEQQLAFERQEPPPAIIKNDYWTPAADGQPADGPNRRGLTGSARLLRDLTELDGYAFETNRRKANLEHTLSLALDAPEAFAEFRRTGVLPFTTRMEAFDRRFPGDYLRLIRRVRVSVVALIPPTRGIAATLTCSGQSRVVVQRSGVFTDTTLSRPPETVAYTSPQNATGTFELDPQPELKYRFEDHGVATAWEFRLPKPANPIDYRTIADVLVTLDYTSLHDAEYGRQVRGALPRRLQGTVALSIRDDYPDAWYELCNASPDDRGSVPAVSLRVTNGDFPRNVGNVRLDALALLVIRAGTRAEDAPELAVDRFDLVRGDRRIHGGAATAVRDVISTRLGAGAWQPLLEPPGGDWDPAPTGDWELAFSSAPETRDQLRSGAVVDVVLVLSYRAETPAWPGEADAVATAPPVIAITPVPGGPEPLRLIIEPERGTVTRFDSATGLGAITPAGGGEEIEVDRSGVLDGDAAEIVEGAAVAFNRRASRAGDGGSRAVNVVVLETPIS
jgi:cold shock CspA family protein